MKLFLFLSAILLVGGGCAPTPEYSGPKTEPWSMRCKNGQMVTGTRYILEDVVYYPTDCSDLTCGYFWKEPTYESGKPRALDAKGTTYCELNNKTHYWEPVK